ncbi:cytochrome oxidase assembly protein-domain-containing protein [Blastocladiella britannica]|nr:cytochrome oxidase assembly protein-domain-containing protein [Blastocladiella britannica]
MVRIVLPHLRAALAHLRPAASWASTRPTITRRAMSTGPPRHAFAGRVAPMSVNAPTSSTSARMRAAAFAWSRAAARRGLSTVAAPATASHGSSIGATTLVSHPIVGRWFLFSASLVFGIVVVGGITRLTESGLSITEWNVVRGMAWPSSQEAWEVEFSKYQESPEYKILNHSISLSEFKNIFYWEWLHRNLGRTIGAVFLLPTIYFTFTRPSASRIAKALAGSAANPAVAARWITPGMTKVAWTCCVFVGFQGALGWYMVKSGLENDILDHQHATPRVSQYRLAAHLGSAFVIYILSLWSGMEVLSQWRQAVVSGPSPYRQQLAALPASALKAARSFRGSVHGVAALVFLTALSGAFVAGLDAGLVYNTWPLMGGAWIPPTPELFRKISRTSINGNAEMQPVDPTERITLADLIKDGRWKNVFENPATVQFDHRMLAYTTLAGISAVFVKAHRLALPPPVRTAAAVLLGAGLGQATLGVLTLLYFVPLELAAAHQGGSLVVLSSALWLMQRMKQVMPLRK